MKAVLQIETALHGQQTWLKSSLFTTPLKLANITEDKQDKTLRLMVMSSSPGILDGDHYEISLDLAAHTHLQLQTQSYQRLFHMKEGASQLLKVKIGEGASFEFLPHPSVPHAASIFSASSQFYLSHNSRLLFGEILTCGRKMNAEVFAFSKYHNRTVVYLGDRIVFHENLLLEPEKLDPRALGTLEGYTHQAGLVFLDPAASIQQIIEKIDVFLSQYEDITYGITVAQVNGFILRILGSKAEMMHDALKLIAAKL